MLVTHPETIVLVAPDADAMRGIGERLAPLLRAGDLVIATGDLGAGKTTLTQGLGVGMGVAGPVVSPTFVISRIHRAESDGPDLVHVDAYRLGSFEEVEDLDLEETMARSVTLIEWGEGLAEGLADDRLELVIRRSSDHEDETREVLLTGIGERWQNAGLEELR